MTINVLILMRRWRLRKGGSHVLASSPWNTGVVVHMRGQRQLRNPMIPTTSGLSWTHLSLISTSVRLHVKHWKIRQYTCRLIQFLYFVVCLSAGHSVHKTGLISISPFWVIFAKMYSKVSSFVLPVCISLKAQLLYATGGHTAWVATVSCFMIEKFWPGLDVIYTT